MQTYSQSFAANTTWETNVPGKYFVLMGCSYAVNVRLYKGGKLLELGEIKNILAGLEVEAEYDRVQVDVTAGDTVSIGIGNGQAHYNRGVANVTVTNTNGVMTNTQKTVTNASTQLLAANANRRYLLIQNKDAAGYVYISFGAGAATTANGVKIAPGGSYVSEVYCTNQAIQAIGDIASNANVVAVEG